MALFGPWDKIKTILIVKWTEPKSNYFAARRNCKNLQNDWLKVPHFMVHSSQCKDKGAGRKPTAFL